MEFQYNRPFFLIKEYNVPKKKIVKILILFFFGGVLKNPVEKITMKILTFLGLYLKQTFFLTYV